MSKDKRIVFYLSNDEYHQLRCKAEECGLTVNAYAKQKVLDDTDNVKLKRNASRAMAELYRWSELTEDLAAREYLRKGGDLLWQCLK